MGTSTTGPKTLTVLRNWFLQSGIRNHFLARANSRFARATAETTMGPLFTYIHKDPHAKPALESPVSRIFAKMPLGYRETWRVGKETHSG